MKRSWPILSGAVAMWLLFRLCPKHLFEGGFLVASATLMVSWLIQGEYVAKVIPWLLFGFIIGLFLGKVIAGDISEQAYGGPIPAEYNIRLDLVFGAFFGGCFGASIAVCAGGYTLRQESTEATGDDNTHNRPAGD